MNIERVLDLEMSAKNTNSQVFIKGNLLQKNSTKKKMEALIWKEISSEEPEPGGIL